MEWAPGNRPSSGGVTNEKENKSGFCNLKTLCAQSHIYIASYNVIWFLLCMQVMIFHKSIMGDMQDILSNVKAIPHNGAWLIGAIKS